MTFPANIDVTTLDGTVGFKTTTLLEFGLSPLIDGVGVSSGDVNGDGFDDLIISDKYDNSVANYGVTYVVFGKAAGFGSFLDLSALDSTTGFRIANGEALFAGFSAVSAGDINGDGFDDLLLGNPGAPYAFAVQNSFSYVVFGKATGFADVDMTTLDGTDGFKITGGTDSTGWSVAAAGDLNGDGFSDFLVGAPDHFFGSGHPTAYVVYGKASGFGANLDLSTLGSNGTKFSGGADGTGMSIASAGDINGDGFLDVVIGAPFADSGRGVSYVVFGSASGFASNVDLTTLDGTNGFKMHSISLAADGFSVASAGDINGDGFDDVIVGHPGGTYFTSQSFAYVVFGKASGFAADMNLYADLNGANGFKVSTGTAADQTGFSVASAGDLNGDGFDDIAIGAPGLYGATGHVYIIYGKASGFAASINPSSLDGTNGFILTGGAGDAIGGSLSAAGDLNGDGADDLMVGGKGGTTYVIYGEAPDDSSVNDIGTAHLDILKGSQSDDTLVGSGGNDRLYAYAGDDVLSGGNGNDVLAGGVGDDTLVGGNGIDTAYYAAEQAGVTANLLTGKASGASTGHDTLVTIENLTGSSFNDVLTGDNNANQLVGLAGNDLLDGGMGADAMAGGSGNDTYVVDSAGDMVTELMNEGTDTVKTILASYTLGPNVENLRFIGSGDFSGTGNALNNSITGGAGMDSLTGGSGNDVLDGGMGADTMTGGTGNDGYTVDNAGDVVAELVNEGTDTVKTTLASYTLGENVENLRFTGTGDFNGTGNALNNSIIGGNGNDTLGGGAGSDKLTGGAGIDTFRFDTLLGSGNIDTVVDFDAAHETIVLDSSVFTGLSLGVLTQFSLNHAIGSGAQIVYNQTTGGLYFDTNGSHSGGATRFAMVTGAPSLTADNFTVVPHV